MAGAGEMEIEMRKLITAMKVSVDGKMEGAQDMADWVEAWSDDYGLTSEVDACVLGRWSPALSRLIGQFARRRPIQEIRNDLRC